MVSLGTHMIAVENSISPIFAPKTVKHRLISCYYDDDGKRKIEIPWNYIEIWQERFSRSSEIISQLKLNTKLKISAIFSSAARSERDFFMNF